MNTRKQSLIDLRKKAMEASIGSEIKCPSCGTVHKKTAYNVVFCKTHGGTVCKDNYWNNVTPTKRNNRTRISPASARYMALQDDLRRPMNTLAMGKFQGYTSEGYRIYNGIAFDEWDEEVYHVDPNEDTHPFDVGDAGDKDR